MKKLLIRTRLTPENREKLRTAIQEIASSSKLESYPNYPIFIGIDKNDVIHMLPVKI